MASPVDLCTCMGLVHDLRGRRGGRYPGTCIVGPDEGTCPMLLHLYWTGLPPVDRRSEEVTSVREGPVREPTLSLAPEYAGWIRATKMTTLEERGTNQQPCALWTYARQFMHLDCGRSPPCCGWIAMKIGRTWIARTVINETKRRANCRGWIRLSKSARRPSASIGKA